MSSSQTEPCTNKWRAKFLPILKKKAPSRILSQRIFKSTVNTTIALILCLNSHSLNHLGGQPVMLPLISVIVHPGRRVGTMFEATMFCVTGLLLGNSYALFSRFVAQKILGDLWFLDDAEQLVENYSRYRAALAWLAVMQVLMLFFHGWMRCITHKFFAIVFPVFLVVHFAFSDNIHLEAGTIVKNYTVPFFVGIALSWACNLLIFPEFGSSYLGRSITESLNELHHTVDSSVQFFVSLHEGESERLGYLTRHVTLGQLNKHKASFRSKLNATQAVLQECLYEISIAKLSPLQLKPVISLFKSNSPSISALINACQLELTMLLRDKESPSSHGSLLIDVLQHSKIAIFELHKVMSQSLYITKLVIAHSYGVKESKVQISRVLPNDSLPNLSQKDIDSQIEALTQAMAIFEVTYRQELQYLGSTDQREDPLAPNDEMFLLSSFLMNLRETANTVCNMLKESSSIYKKRKQRENESWFGGYRLWLSFLTGRGKLNLKGWFATNATHNFVAGNENASLNDDGEASNTMRVFIKDETATAKQQSSKQPIKPVLYQSKSSNVKSFSRLYFFLVRHWTQFLATHRGHFRFGFQIAVGLMLATFPMFVPQSRHWFFDIHGTWIGFVCILVLEQQMGGTFFVFFLRFVGVISGSAWGYLSYVAGGKHGRQYPVVQVIVTIVYAIPGYYYFLGTPYVKAAIIGIISVYVVMLSSILPTTIAGGILSNFGKRCLAMIYGGAVALFCQLLFFPIKARDELATEVGRAAGNVSQLMVLYASGLDGEEDTKSLIMSQRRFEKFTQLSEATRASLIKADAFREEAKREPRLKSSFKEGSKIFEEVIFILREILDRLDNIILLRRSYGSAIIENYNADVYPYRRQVTASMNSCLKAVELALLTKEPMPQYMPSPKVSHDRLIEKIRSIVNKKPHDLDSDSESGHVLFRNKQLDFQLLKTDYLSWNATTSSLEEIIHYTEELIELVKLLVGVFEFKYGFLSRSIYKDYAEDAKNKFNRLKIKDVNMERGLSQAVTTRVFDHLRGPTTAANDKIDNDSGIQRTPTFEKTGLISTTSNSELDKIPSAVNKGEAVFPGDQSSIKIDSTSISKKFRRRYHSVGSWAGGFKRNDDNGLVIMGPKDLDQVDSDDSEVKEDESEEELPLALKKVVSRKVFGGK